MKEILVIGLGNPGTRFTNTRHNLGQRAVENWCIQINGDSAPVWQQSPKKELYRTTTVGLGMLRVTCLIPLTFMNDAGLAIEAFLSAHVGQAPSMIVVHDDLETPLGDLRIVDGGSAKGHNGVRSIQEKLGRQDIPRVRLGIGRPTDSTSVEDFVLRPFADSEQDKVQEMLTKATQALNQFAESGFRPSPE